MRGPPRTQPLRGVSPKRMALMKVSFPLMNEIKLSPISAAGYSTPSSTIVNHNSQNAKKALHNKYWKNEKKEKNMNSGGSNSQSFKYQVTKI